MKSAIAFLLLVIAVRAQAQQAVPPPAPTLQDKTQSSPRLNPAVSERAEHLSEQMARDLRLNGYQSARLRAINHDKIAKLEAAERQYAADPTQLDQHTQAIAQERDQELQTVLTTDQYTDYFDARKRYAQADRNYARNAASAILVNSVQNPTPARANDAILSPARPTKPSPRGKAQRTGPATRPRR